MGNKNECVTYIEVKATTPGTRYCEGSEVFVRLPLSKLTPKDYCDVTYEGSFVFNPGVEGVGEVMISRMKTDLGLQIDAHVKIEVLAGSFLRCSRRISGSSLMAEEGNTWQEVMLRLLPGQDVAMEILDIYRVDMRRFDPDTAQKAGADVCVADIRMRLFRRQNETE